jgi:putative ubiquitin-RnfH superfamily antitoxin RatB of RatAB toxin-antitoxin module
MGAGDFAVKLVCAWPERSFVQPLRVDAGITIAVAVERSGVLERFPELREQGLNYGVFGRVVTADHVLRPGERIELLRPLLHDPKQTRRQLAAQGQSIGVRKARD